MRCATCKDRGYLLTAPSTCSAGGERLDCPVCKPSVRMTTQQDSVDVERLRAVIHNDAILFGQIEQRMRECWIGTGKLCEDGSASNDFRVWMNEAHNRQRDLKAALGQNPSLPLAALSLPITQRDEQGDRTYADGVEDAAEITRVIEAWRNAKRLGLRVLTFGMWKPAAIRRLSIEQGDQDGGER